MYNPGDSSSDSGAGASGGRNSRYAYLVGRLRSRQITMEEATELFSLMQASVSRAEAGRMAALAQLNASAGASNVPPPPPPPLVMGGGASADDFLVLGLLTMGAGAGLLAAMTRKIQELPPAGGAAAEKSASK